MRNGPLRSLTWRRNASRPWAWQNSTARRTKAWASSGGASPGLAACVGRMGTTAATQAPRSSVHGAFGRGGAGGKDAPARLRYRVARLPPLRRPSQRVVLARHVEKARGAGLLRPGRRTRGLWRAGFAPRQLDEPAARGARPKRVELVFEPMSIRARLVRISVREPLEPVRRNGPRSHFGLPDQSGAQLAAGTGRRPPRQRRPRRQQRQKQSAYGAARAARGRLFPRRRHIRAHRAPAQNPPAWRRLSPGIHFHSVCSFSRLKGALARRGSVQSRATCRSVNRNFNKTPFPGRRLGAECPSHGVLGSLAALDERPAPSNLRAHEAIARHAHEHRTRPEGPASGDDCGAPALSSNGRRGRRMAPGPPVNPRRRSGAAGDTTIRPPRSGWPGQTR